MSECRWVTKAIFAGQSLTKLNFLQFKDSSIHPHRMEVNGRRVFVNYFFHGCVTTPLRELDTALEVGPCSFPWKLLSCTLNPKWFNFLGLKLPRSSYYWVHRATHYRLLTATSGLALMLTWMGIKLFNPAALLNVPNVPSYDNEKSFCRGLCCSKTPIHWFTDNSFTMRQYKVIMDPMASHDIVILQFGHSGRVALWGMYCRCQVLRRRNLFCCICFDRSTMLNCQSSLLIMQLTDSFVKVVWQGTCLFTLQILGIHQALFF